MRCLIAGDAGAVDVAVARVEDGAGPVRAAGAGVEDGGGFQEGHAALRPAEPVPGHWVARMGQNDADDLAAQVFTAGRNLDDCAAIGREPSADGGYVGSVCQSNTAA